MRCQLAAIGCPIKGDLKYGLPRNNKDGNSLQSCKVHFVYPAKEESLTIITPKLNDSLWGVFVKIVGE